LDVPGRLSVLVPLGQAIRDASPLSRRRGQSDVLGKLGGAAVFAVASTGHSQVGQLADFTEPGGRGRGGGGGRGRIWRECSKGGWEGGAELYAERALSTEFTRGVVESFGGALERGGEEEQQQQQQQ